VESEIDGEGEVERGWGFGRGGRGSRLLDAGDDEVGEEYKESPVYRGDYD
jgi:hypothetical protein